ncbi:MAG: 50S ribosomal protein L7/L12 [Puniceicoccales bacterium]|jgi:large subunit ribosomal protein L7/L12|nr:50S ribosomal protein L7/L12 [Puniceicoccales bacterium]
MAEITKEQVIEWLGARSVIEIAALVKELEERWGVSAAAPVVAAAVAAPVVTEEEEKTEFTVMLLSGGDAKINVIKEIRALTGLGLIEAKNMVEGAPKAIKEGIAKAEAEEMRKRLEAVGAKIELR